MDETCYMSFENSRVDVCFKDRIEPDKSNLYLHLQNVDVVRVG